VSFGIRSIAAPVHDRSGRVAAAVNVTVHAAETSIEQLTGDYLPYLLDAASEVTDAWANLSLLPAVRVDSTPPARV
jgi:IclR family pca regulon transcriptional regulator